MPAISPEDFDAAFDLPNEEAEAYLRAKGYELTWSWKDLKAEAHERAFTVAKVMNMDILKDIRTGLESSQAAGTPLEDFQKRMEPFLVAKGWWGRQTVVSPTGELETVQLGSPWRLKTIYQTNLQSSYMAGRLKGQVATIQRRPYGRMRVVGDVRSSKICPPLDGKVFLMSELIGSGLYPPLHHNCRTEVETLSPAQLAREGLDVTPIDQSPSRPAPGFEAPPTDPFEPDLSRYPEDIAAQYTRAVELRRRPEPVKPPLETDKPAPASPASPEAAPQAGPERDPLDVLPDMDRDETARKLFNPATVTVSDMDGYEEEIHDTVDDLFGRQLEPREVARLTGSMTDAEIIVKTDDGSVLYEIYHPLLQQPSHRTLQRDVYGRLELSNDLLMLSDTARRDHPKLGLRIFATQVSEARKLGVDHIAVYAAGERGNPVYNGYYTWPRFGYDGEIPYAVSRLLPESMEHMTQISELMATKEGRAFWKEHGSSVTLEFDLTEGSYSMTTLRAYLKEAGITL